MHEAIDDLIQLAKAMQAASQRGEDPGLNEDEICFDDALAMNENAVQAMGNDELKVIAAELVTSVRQSVTIDWTVRESARTKIRVMVRRSLTKQGFVRWWGSAIAKRFRPLRTCAASECASSWPPVQSPSLGLADHGPSRPWACYPSRP